jgi:hypothetical protein
VSDEEKRQLLETAYRRLETLVLRSGRSANGSRAGAIRLRTLIELHRRLDSDPAWREEIVRAARLPRDIDVR